ncbi:hypothetical protein [Actinacidiphila rubida]|uniref:Uncharacterized protein n=1 Tax=Actinacidiphila rubida TaxID=310780 RepID=A0A1H8DG74_9ACTN|nr:hypothetical protein [Actinacidiphila rubida]SEN06166.1 hypothetical protein SAMN05216267_100191 [Actinacidiphila rubida]
MTTVPVINETAAWSWLDRTGWGPVAFLLLVHPDPAAGELLARSLRLAPAARRLPDVGDRVAVLGAEHAAVRLDGSEHLIRVPVGERWCAFVRGGGPAALVVGLAPLPRRATADDVASYLARNAVEGRLRLGLSRVPEGVVRPPW